MGEGWWKYREAQLDEMIMRPTITHPRTLLSPRQPLIWHCSSSFVFEISFEACEMQSGIGSRLALSGRASITDFKVDREPGMWIKRREEFRRLGRVQSLCFTCCCRARAHPCSTSQRVVRFDPTRPVLRHSNRNRAPNAKDTHQAALWLPHHSLPSSAYRASCAMPSTTWSLWMPTRCITNSRSKQANPFRKRPS